VKRLKYIAKLLAVNLLVLAALLLLTEVVLRIMGYGYSNSPADPDPYLHHVHPNNHLFKVYTPGGEFGDFMVYYDSLGRRSKLPDSIRNGPRPVKGFVFMGDSFVEGLQVPYEQSFMGLVEKQLPQYQFLNYGVTGYGPLLNYLQCRKMLHEHKVFPHAVVMLLYSNDVRDDSTYFRRSVRDSTGQVLAVNGGKKNSLVAFVRQFYLARAIRKAYIRWKFQRQFKNPQQVNGVPVRGLLEEQPGIENTLTEQYLLETDSLLQANNIAFYLSAVPSRYENLTGNHSLTTFSEKAGAWAHAHGIPFIALDSAFTVAGMKGEKLFYNIDIHCNAAGHRVIAEVFSKELFTIGSHIYSMHPPTAPAIGNE
jgi:hypothetical protein